MSTPFLAEIKWVGFNYAPRGWAQCNGQLLPINQNQALFSLLGTMYGGNGQTTFALPDLRGRIPLHVGAGFTQGQNGGQEAHTVTLSEMPLHTHFLRASNNTASQQSGAGAVLATVPGRIYSDPVALTTLTPQTVTSVGGTQAHNNMQPYLVMTAMIALQGIFPSRN